MKLLTLIILIWTSLDLSARTITDMAGRIVTIPDTINKAVPYDNKTNVLIFPIAREKMIVKARAKFNQELKYISNEFLHLKEIDTRNAEDVLRLAPDLIVVGTFTKNKTNLSNYIRFSEKINIPLVIVDLDLTHLDESYTFLGELFKCQERAAQYVTYIQTLYADIEIYRNAKVQGTAYLANASNGFRTAPNSSQHAELFDIMNIDNAVYAKINTNGFAIVSMEQILVWNPDYIFCLGKGEKSPYRTILKSALWKQINAVKNNHVYFIPAEPYPWVDMPPSVNRLAGLIWFSEIFHKQPPEITKSKIKEFYRLFYLYELNDKEYAHLYTWQ